MEIFKGVGMGLSCVQTSGMGRIMGRKESMSHTATQEGSRIGNDV